MDLVSRCRSIELILSDVDGVLTDGGVIFDNQGIEIKRFHIRDGLGIKLWQRAGHHFGLVTGRASHIVQLRAVELGVDIVRQGIDDKLPAVKQILSQRQLQAEKVCYVGDDLPDLPVLRHVGFAVVVGDGCQELQAAAHYVTQAQGGRGAVREVIELILKAQGRWDDVLQKYGTG
ncbi:MAG TPA: HAD hydrolase family protein [Pirellulales bacterium]|nr:HAD hydrolase family protein [Pirellulales bacterium]